MANLARTLKSPYLSPRFRPSMPNRTMPSSPDFSLTSPNSPLSDYFGDLVAFGRNTQTLASGRPGLSRDGNQGGEDATPSNFRVPGALYYFVGMECCNIHHWSSAPILSVIIYPAPISVDLPITWPQVTVFGGLANQVIGSPPATIRPLNPCWSDHSS